MWVIETQVANAGRISHKSLRALGGSQTLEANPKSKVWRVRCLGGRVSFGFDAHIRVLQSILGERETEFL